MQDFFPAEKAAEFATTRGWLKVLLASYAGLADPGAIRIAIADGGKPHAPDFPEIRFNLSHSSGLVVFAFSRYEVGIDIEKLRPITGWQELAEGLLSPGITAEINSLGEAQQAECFLKHFTAREAFLKMQGAGFAGAHDLEKYPGTNSRVFESVYLPEIPGYLGCICLAKAH